MLANHSLGFATSAADSKHPELWNGLVSSWVPALGNTGLLVPDYSRNRNNGTQVGLDPATDWLIGKYGSYLEFTGDGEYVNLPKDIGGQVMSLIVWVKPSFTYNEGSPFSNNIFGAVGLSGGWLQLFYDAASGTRRYKLSYRFSFGTTISLEGDQFNSNADFQRWTPVAITYDNNAGAQSLWVDGARQDSGTATTNAYPGSTAWVMGDAAIGNRSWTGGIASVQAYNRVLTDNEIKLLSIRPGILHERRADVIQLFQSSVGGQTLTPSLFDDDDTFYTHTVTAGAVTLTPSLHTDSDNFHSATVSTSTTLTASLFNDSDTFYSATVTTGTVTLTPSLYSDDDTFYTATVSQGSSPQELTPSLFTDDDTFYTATVSPGEVTLTASLFADSDSFYTPTITASYDLTPDLYSDSDTFYTATITTGAVTITPSLYDDGDTFYTHTIALGGATQELTPSLFNDSDTFHSATVNTGAVTLSPSLFSDDDTFYDATISIGAITLTPSLFSDSDTFYTPNVSSIYALTPVLYTDSDSFYAPVVSVGAVTLTASLFSDDDTFYAHTITGGGALNTPLSRTFSIQGENRVYSIF